MTEENLIILVQKYPCLYDMELAEYSDQRRKENAWEEIGKILNLRVEDCKKRWTRIRENYRKALKKRQTPRSGSAAAVTRPIKYDNILSFLNKYYVDRATVTNVSPTSPQAQDLTDSESLSTETTAYDATHQTSNYRSSDTGEQSLAKLLVDYFKSNKAEENDPLTTFFSCMTQTVKTFPLEIQLEVKRKIFEIVSDAESALLCTYHH